MHQGSGESECLRVAYAIAHSPLVKTAFYAGDPNWGRILAAVGRAGVEDLNMEDLRLFLDDVCVFACLLFSDKGDGHNVISNDRSLVLGHGY